MIKKKAVSAMKEKKLIIIPAYNESESIQRVIEDVRRFKDEFDFVVINDCSTDNTSEIARACEANVIDLPINLGIGGCVQTGYKYALKNGYDIAVQFDGDGQHDADYLIPMYEFLKSENADMVIGSRFIDKVGFQSSSLRRVGIKLITFVIKLTTKRTITDPTSGFRMVNKKIIELFARDYPVDYPESETNAIVLRKGYSVAEMPVVMKERLGGVSSITLKKACYFMPKVMLAILIDRFR